MDIKLTFAIIVGKTISFLTTIAGGGATAAPGLYALRIDPHLVKKLSEQIKYGSIIISGTNGKTTTARLTSSILSTKFKIVHNRQGSNLLRGIASTMISRSSLLGRLTSDIAIWEVDEATVPEAVLHTNPKTIVLLNLFRDQLDRYGEVDSVRTKWQRLIEKLPKESTLILNADDPGVSYLAKFHKGKVLFFGIRDQKLNLPQIAHVADIRHCLNCGSNLNYSVLLSTHMGHYSCPNCHFKRPEPQISASNLQFSPNFSTSLKLNDNGQLSNVTYNLPGLYNVYNVLATSAIGNSLKIRPFEIKKGIEEFSSAFGRFQQVKIDSKSIVIFLIKNPAGANEVIRTISQKNRLDLLVILNDNIADGRDVSWIWDTNWEVIKNKTKNISVSGTRAWDLATRLKYAGFKMSKENVYENINYSIKASLNGLSNNDTLLILPTYTALLEVQKSLSKLAGTTKWHEQ